MKERLIGILKKYIPEEACPLIVDWLIGYQTKLIVSPNRHTKLGDYRAPFDGAGHCITINHNLNKYSFLITLVHEFAHLSNWILYKHDVSPHGPEWKLEFKRHMWFFLQSGLFPEDVEKALRKYMANPAASSCSDMNLMRVLKKYDPDAHLTQFLDQLPMNAAFKIPDGRAFIKGPKLRKRYKCKEISSNKQYLISPIIEIVPL